MPVSRRILIPVTLVLWLVMLLCMLGIYTYIPNRRNIFSMHSSKSQPNRQPRDFRRQLAANKGFDGYYQPTRGLDADAGHSAEIQGQKEECSWPCYLERYRDVRVTLDNSQGMGHVFTRAAWHYEAHGKREGRGCTCGGATACAVPGRTVCQRHACSWVCYLKTYPALLKEFGGEGLWKAAARHYEMGGKTRNLDCGCAPQPWWMDFSAEIQAKLAESERKQAHSWLSATGQARIKELEAQLAEVQAQKSTLEDMLDAAVSNTATITKAQPLTVLSGLSTTSVLKPMKVVQAKLAESEECSWACHLERYRDVRVTLGKSNPPRCPVCISVCLSVSQYTSQ